ncbi:3824_t:CDS:2 [Funneliformis geosporum]|uniref:11078_t:CDS:1 n=1 Tax=Funneliformis geosporum TaxID=1117311 RepID=A0A9W4SFA0_9GLOM|nr:3824_t:CDS:2 [Funneliformis geosporum]CAI2166939.1 11078_t:CDS:2 [Funneliformis geosporum]
MFAETYNVIDACPIFAYNENLTFLLKDTNKALNNFLFHRENLCYIDEETHHLTSVKEVEDEAIRNYRQDEKTQIVISEKSLQL